MPELPRMDVVAVANPGVDAAAPAVIVIAMRPSAGPDQPVAVDADHVGLLSRLGVDLPRRLTRARATGARGELIWVDLEEEAPEAVLVVGLGSGGQADIRRAAAAAVRRLRGYAEVLVMAKGLSSDGITAFVEGLYLGSGSPTWASVEPSAPPARVRMVVGDVPLGQEAVASGARHSRATLAARWLIHTPSNDKSPERLADEAAAVARSTGLGWRVWDAPALERDGFGGILAVGSGSARQPRLVELQWGRGPAERPAEGLRPGGPAAGPGAEPAAVAADADPMSVAPTPRHVVLVGKGITFDSGGLSLKKPEMQIAMKTDMSGAAVVLAVLAALAHRPAQGLWVTGLLCLAENMPGAAATRPGDVVTHHGGLTSEVVNTDAEGRLVLGDGLDYAVRDLGADVVVDVATLTGAATVALGRGHAALFSNDDGLAAALTAAGEAAGELVWRMPLHAEYAELISSDVADQANSGRGTAAGPGAITAALFLQRFVAGTRWAHLDIAGPARSEVDREDLPKGGTGFGVRLMLRWIEAGAPLQPR